MTTLTAPAPSPTVAAGLTLTAPAMPRHPITVYPLQDLRKLARRRPCPLCGRKSRQGMASLVVRSERQPLLSREVVCPEHGKQIYSVAL